VNLDPVTTSTHPSTPTAIERELVTLLGAEAVLPGAHEDQSAELVEKVEPRALGGNRRKTPEESDAGFDPVIVGKLADARRFQRGNPGYGQSVTAAELKQKLMLTP